MIKSSVSYKIVFLETFSLRGFSFLVGNLTGFIKLPFETPCNKDKRERVNKFTLHASEVIFGQKFV